MSKCVEEKSHTYEGGKWPKGKRKLKCGDLWDMCQPANQRPDATKEYIKESYLHGNKPTDAFSIYIIYLFIFKSLNDCDTRYITRTL